MYLYPSKISFYKYESFVLMRENAENSYAFSCVNGRGHPFCCYTKKGFSLRHVGDKHDFLTFNTFSNVSNKSIISIPSSNFFQ
jgi:hypothetical protein